VAFAEFSLIPSFRVASHISRQNELAQGPRLLFGVVNTDSQFKGWARNLSCHGLTLSHVGQAWVDSDLA
jgi:hypothetical protein